MWGKVAKMASEATPDFHGGSMPQFHWQMCVICALNVPMLYPRLILATPLLLAVYQYHSLASTVFKNSDILCALYLLCQ